MPDQHAVGSERPPTPEDEMPDDLRRVLEDAGVTIPRDTEVWELLGRWQKARASTESAPTYAEVVAERNAALLALSAQRAGEPPTRAGEGEAAKELAREAFGAGIVSGEHFEDWWELHLSDQATDAALSSQRAGDGEAGELRRDLAYLAECTLPLEECPPCQDRAARLVAGLSGRAGEPPTPDERLRELSEAIHRLNVNWTHLRTDCGDMKCMGDCKYVQIINRILDEVLGTSRRAALDAARRETK